MDNEPEPEPEVDDDPVDVPNQKPESYCRFCFSETDVEPLFPANQSHPGTEMYDRLYECIGIRLTKEDYYPSGICWMCSLTMEEFQCFRKRCLKYDTLVRSLQARTKTTTPSGDVKEASPTEPEPNVKLPSVVFRKGKKIKKQPLGPLDAKLHQCVFCPRTFSRKMYLDQHMWKHRDLVQLAKMEPGMKKMQLDRPIKQEKAWIPIVKPSSSAANGSITSGKLKDGTINCEYCPRKFSRRMYYIQHMRKHSKKESVIRCRHCPRTFLSTRSRRAHEKKEHIKILDAENQTDQKAPFSCPQCSRTFKYRYSLRMHLLNHDGQLPYACDICNCRFYSMAYLTVHKKRYHGPNAICGDAGNEAIISCLYCTRSFLRECDRSSHIKQMHSNMLGTYNEAEHGVLPELMDDCPPADTDGLTDPELLPPNVHEPVMEIKEEEPDSHQPGQSTLPSGGIEPDNPLFYCYSCAMSFDTEDMYAEHLDDQHPFGGEQMMEHLQSGSPVGEQDEKEFRCPYCPKTFTRKWTMTEHIPTHLGTRRYPCELCPAIFCRDSYLRTHRSRKHPNEAEKYNGTFKCRYCPRMFVMERYKKVHEKIAHIKKGDVLPVENDTNSELAPSDSNAAPVVEMDESSCSVVQEPPPCTSDDFDVESITPAEANALESVKKLVIELQPIPLHVLVDYQWQLDWYENAPYDEQCDDAETFAESEETTNSSFPHDELNNSELPRTKIGITLHPCGLCTKMFKSRTALRKHSMYHSGALPHRCDECGVQFMRSGLLVEHKARYHGENGQQIADRYSCDYCPRIFLRKQDRTCHHLMVHARDQAKALENDIDASPTIGHKKSKKDYLCKVCGELYEKYHTCQRHINRAHPTADGEEEIKPLKLCHCTICTSIFKKRDDWKEHLDLHPKVPSHHCEQCIRRHRKKWGRKMIHRCSFCPKAFLHKPNLNSHLRIHKQQLRFPCGECDAMYDRYRDLATHKIRYHSDDSVPLVSAKYKCAYCPRVFMRPRDVNYHQQSVHADRANQTAVELEDDLMSLDPTTLLGFADHALLGHCDDQKPIKLEPEID